MEGSFAGIAERVTGPEWLVVPELFQWAAVAFSTMVRISFGGTTPATFSTSDAVS
jgi:hypothetical protein